MEAANKYCFLCKESCICNTKAAERSRRYSKKFSADIEFHEDMNVTVAQENFLSNSKNKSSLISSLMKKFVENNIEVKQADEDADTLIVLTAIQSMTSK